MSVDGTMLDAFNECDIHQRDKKGVLISPVRMPSSTHSAAYQEERRTYLCDGEAADVGVPLCELLLVHIRKCTCRVASGCSMTLCTCMQTVLERQSVSSNSAEPNTSRPPLPGSM